jgi:hypothetical protein
MPKVSRSIPDELILAKFSDRNALSDDLWLIPPQVSMLIGRSVDQLEEDRKVGNPPKSMKPWGEKGPVRYRIGTVRDFMLGPAAEEYSNTTQAKIALGKRTTMGLGFMTFQDWIDGARSIDEWPFLIRKGSAPIDFFKSLGMGEGLRDDDDCEWLRLDDYLAKRHDAALLADALAAQSELEEDTPLAKASSSDRHS